MKRMMKLVLGALCMVLGAGVAVAETIYITAANFESHRTLQNSNTYRFGTDIDYTARETESALTVADGANVIIEIAAGVTVKLTGGAASGMTGAGAGIEVPENAKLIICGEGTLNATGGAGEPFTLGEGSVTVTVKAIPGLKYWLWRLKTLDAESAVSSKPPYQVVVATGTTVTLKDENPPADKAFYLVGVSVP